MNAYKKVKFLVHVSEIDLGSKVESMVDLLVYLKSNIHKIIDTNDQDSKIEEHQISFVPTRHETDVVINLGEVSFETDFEHQEFIDSLEEIKEDLLHYVDESILSDEWCMVSSDDMENIVHTVLNGKNKKCKDIDADDYLAFLGERIDHNNKDIDVVDTDITDNGSLKTAETPFLTTSILSVADSKQSLPEQEIIQEQGKSDIFPHTEKETTESFKDDSRKVSDQIDSHVDTPSLTSNLDILIDENLITNRNDIRVFKHKNTCIFFIFSLNLALKVNTKNLDIFIINEIRDVFKANDFKSLITKAKKKLSLGTENNVNDLSPEIIQLVKTELLYDIKQRIV